MLTRSNNPGSPKMSCIRSVWLVDNPSLLTWTESEKQTEKRFGRSLKNWTAGPRWLGASERFSSEPFWVF